MSIKDLIKNYQDHAKGINLHKKKISAGLEIKKQIYEDALHTKKMDTKKNVIDEPVKKAIKEKISDWKLLDDLANHREPKQEIIQEPKQDVKQLVPKNVSEGIKEKQKKYVEAIKKDNVHDNKQTVDIPEQKFNEKLSDWKLLDALANGGKPEKKDDTKKEIMNDKKETEDEKIHDKDEEIEKPKKHKKKDKKETEDEPSEKDEEIEKPKKHKKKDKKETEDEPSEKDEEIEKPKKHKKKDKKETEDEPSEKEESKKHKKKKDKKHKKHRNRDDNNLSS